MAINIVEVPRDKICTSSQSSFKHHKQGASASSHLNNVDLTTESSISGLTNRLGKRKKRTDRKSPYLKADSVQVLSRVTEKRFVHKNDDVVSPFPLGTNVYKFDSKDFKSSRKNGKKLLKSVVTQPNNTAPFPQLSTESDMTESEYYSEKDNICKNNKKRNQSVHPKKCRSGPKDRDENYFTSMDIHLDSSNDTLKKFDNRILKRSAESKGDVEGKFNPHDVWAVLRNMNRFQFIPTPEISEPDFIMPKKKNRRNNRSDMRVFKTRRTEEFAYISSYIEASPCHSHSSSFDKVTVVDKKQDIKLNKDIDDKLKKKKAHHLNSGFINRTGPKSKAGSVKCNNIKEVTNVKQKESNNSVKSGEELFDAIDSNFKDPKEILEINASVDLGYESKTTDFDDQTSFDNDTTQMSQYSEAIYSDNSGSSKAAFLKSAPRKRVLVKGKAVVTDASDKTVSGITKVVLRGNNANQLNQRNNIEPTKQIARPISIDNTCNMITPKLTKMDINRQLNKYRFPIVVLGKDQLKTPTQFINNNHIQFDGLEERIWPFMMSWYGVDRSEKGMKRPSDSAASKKVKREEVEKRSKLSNNSPTRHSKLKDKKPKIEPKRAPLPLSEIINHVAQDKRKIKPMSQLKDRMLKLLYKKSSILQVVNESHSSYLVKNEKSSNKVDTCTDTKENFNVSNCYKDVHPTSFNSVNSTSSTITTKVSKAKTQPNVENRSWAKAKWASDFIDNVIKKIKSGVYYNQDSKDYNTQTLTTENKDEEIQTDLIFESKQVIPGFDTVTPEIEIKTMNMNEVAVKHCVTNIVVQFDVAVPKKTIIDAKISPSLVPVDVSQSLNKIFKYKTSIYNAMLPAELCSILPKMLRKIVESQEHLKLSPVSIDKVSCLSTISEIPSEHPSDLMKPQILNILPFISMTETIRKILNGMFSNKETKAPSNFYVITDKTMLVKDKTQLIEELRPRLSRNQLFDLRYPLMMSLVVIKHPNNGMISTTPPSINNLTNAFKTCKALQPYNAEKKVHNVSMLIKISGNMVNYINNNNRLQLFNMFRLINNSFTNVNTTQINQIANLNNTPAVITVIIEQPNTSSYVTKNSKLCILPNVSDTSAKKSLISPGNLRYSTSHVKEPFEINSANSTKMKRKGFVKLYRKCKSVSHIYEEKKTRLSRITNLDDFFQVLGSAKSLANVFDDQFGRKLMSSIQETKNWTTEINSRQALLILLLANKKETQHLLRFRPVILQGIAVKRITKAQELDMEIELIERENLGGISKYDGISYLPASIANKDFLYDELCWIAKNTASDYQKPFDQSSERLLKTLLEKQKKLNPSYLRVMARYVGLGLLKSPGKI